MYDVLLTNISIVVHRFHPDISPYILHCKAHLVKYWESSIQWLKRLFGAITKCAQITDYLVET